MIASKLSFAASLPLPVTCYEFWNVILCALVLALKGEYSPFNKKATLPTRATLQPHHKEQSSVLPVLPKIHRSQSNYRLPARATKYGATSWLSAATPFDHDQRAYCSFFVEYTAAKTIHRLPDRATKYLSASWLSASTSFDRDRCAE
jgi:hypothetical protein